LGLYTLADRKWKTYGDLDDIGDVAFSPDGSRVAFYARQNRKPVFMIFDIATETFTPLPYQRGMRSHPNPSWSPDGKRLAIEIRDPEDPVVALLDPKTSEVQVVAKGGNPRWSPTGEWIAYYAERERCVFIRPDGTGLKEVAKAGEDREFISGTPVWSPDGTQLLLNESKDDRELLDVVLIDLASGRRTTKSRSGLPVFGWASITDSKPEKNKATATVEVTPTSSRIRQRQGGSRSQSALRRMRRCSVSWNWN
jgi:dipeptidyl aminopeptidase/acylaminoacyl peptidase